MPTGCVRKNTLCSPDVHSFSSPLKGHPSQKRTKSRKEKKNIFRADDFSPSLMLSLTATHEGFLLCCLLLYSAESICSRTHTCNATKDGLLSGAIQIFVCIGMYLTHTNGSTNTVHFESIKESQRNLSKSRLPRACQFIEHGKGPSNWHTKLFFHVNSLSVCLRRRRCFCL